MSEDKNTTKESSNDELKRLCNNLNNELDLLTYKLQKTQCDIQDIRRDIHEINRTIDVIRDEIRHNRSSEICDIVTSLFPILAITLPSMFLVIMIFLTKILK